MITKEIYVPIYSYMVRYVEIEDFSYGEKRRVLSYMRNNGYGDFEESIRSKIDEKIAGAGTTYSNNSRSEICILIYPQPSKERRFETIMHEKRHCEDFIIERLGVDDMEAAAYLSGWLSVQIMKDDIQTKQV